MSKKKDGWMTLEEHHAQLKAEGKWEEREARMAAQKLERDRHWERLNKAAEPLVAALNRVDSSITQLWGLRDRPRLSDSVIRVLLDHVSRPEYPDQVKESIVLALGRPETKPYWNTMVEMYRQNAPNFENDDFRASLGIALVSMGNAVVLDDVFQLVRDRSLGKERVPLLLILHRSKDPRARMLLMELQDDPDLASEIKRGRRLARKGNLDL